MPRYLRSNATQGLFLFIRTAQAYVMLTNGRGGQTGAVGWLTNSRVNATMSDFALANPSFLWTTVRGLSWSVNICLHPTATATDSIAPSARPLSLIFQKNSAGWTIFSADIRLSQIFVEAAEFGWKYARTPQIRPTRQTNWDNQIQNISSTTKEFEVLTHAH